MRNSDKFVRIKGAQQNNLKNIDVNIPRDCFVVFTGVSGSGKSSLAFDTIYAEAQRRYFESVAPYARRLIEQLPAPKVAEIAGLPPAVAIQQRRGESNTRSTVGTLTTLSNSLRMLFSRAGQYPADVKERLDSDAFSPNTPAGACGECHGIGLVHSITEESLVPNPNLSIREQAIAAWPGAWQGKNYRDILAVLGYDIDKPWKDLPPSAREWILFTEEKPVVTVHAEREAHRIQRPYQGTYMSAASYVRHTFATTKSETLRKRVAKYMTSAVCSACGGKRLKKQALSVKFAEYDIAELSHLPLSDLPPILRTAHAPDATYSSPHGADMTAVARAITADLVQRIERLHTLGLDYLTLERSTPSLSAGELQRLRLATQLRSGLFGVVYILDEPSAGLHPADTEALLDTLLELKTMGNSLFIVEHDMDLARKADWIVDVGPDAGEQGGQLLYSGEVNGLDDIEESQTRRFLARHNERSVCNQTMTRELDPDTQWLRLRSVYRNNLQDLTVEFPLGTLTAVTGVSGSGKTTLVSKVLAEAVASQLGVSSASKSEEDDAGNEQEDEEELNDEALNSRGSVAICLEGADRISRLVCVDQRAIGRTPRSNLATYTGMFDHIRKLFAATKHAKEFGYSASRFSFNVEGGRCTTCEGEGYVSVELMFLPSVYAPCGACRGTRYNAETLRTIYKGLNIGDVLELTVERAHEFFKDSAAILKSLTTLRSVGLGYLRLGQPATELSGGEAQRIKLATELQRSKKGHTLYLLDEPTTGLHPADTERLILLLKQLVNSGNTVVAVEHDMDVVAASNWVIDLGPGGGAKGGKVVASGTPFVVSQIKDSATATYLARRMPNL